MDPFIEGYDWSSFSSNALGQLQRQLVDQLPSRYLIEVEKGVRADDLILGRRDFYRPDALILERTPAPPREPIRVAPYQVTTPSVFTPLDEVKPRTLTIRDSLSQELVTAIEVLSPANKSGAGLEEYRKKRAAFLRNSVHLVELDLLRGGTPPYSDPNWPEGTYRVQTIDAIERTISFWSIKLADPLPVVTVPLLPSDPSLILNLQVTVEEVFRYSTYDRSINYQPDQLQPTPTPAEREIIAQILGNKG